MAPIIVNINFILIWIQNEAFFRKFNYTRYKVVRIKSCHTYVINDYRSLHAFCKRKVRYWTELVSVCPIVTLPLLSSYLVKNRARHLPILNHCSNIVDGKDHLRLTKSPSIYWKDAKQHWWRSCFEQSGFLDKKMIKRGFSCSASSVLIHDFEDGQKLR